MSAAYSNVSFDGSPVEFRLDSPLLACFDPLALDLIRDSMPSDTSFDIGELLECVNTNYPAMSCHRIPDFRPGVFGLDPRDIQKFGDEELDFDYGDGLLAASEFGDNAESFPFASIDSGTLIVADVAYLLKLVTLLTWEQYDRALGDDAVFPKVAEELGGPFFAVIVSDSRLGMQFDGDGTYTIQPSKVRPVNS